MNEQQDAEEGLNSLAIEGKLPLKAVGIENLKEANPKHMPPNRYLHPWFARRPTPASRLAILASILPEETSSDDLLKWMQIGPKEVEEELAKYVEEKKATEGERSGTLGDHYGYPRPFTQSPTEEELGRLHKNLKDTWDGELPTVLDPTAGGGVIPFESIRYKLPTKANELNPVPSIILKAQLEYAPTVGSIEQEATHWAEKINQRASDNLEKYFPSADDGTRPDTYVSTYKIRCPDCGGVVPLIPKWTIKSGSVFVKPSTTPEGTINYDCITDPDDPALDDFDSSNGYVDRGGEAECPHCNVVTEGDVVREKFREGDFEYEIYCVKYQEKNGGSGFRAPIEEDYEALELANDRVNNDYEIASLLTTERFDGYADRAIPYGVTRLRDFFSPRQLISQYEYLEAFNHYKPKIYEEYEDDKAEAILCVISLACSKLIDRNSRLADWDTSKGYPSRVFKGKILVFTRVFTDNNLGTGTMDFESVFSKVLDSYEETVNYLPDGAEPAEVTTEDAAQLSYDDDIQVAIVDPPYYSSIMYSELADVFYGWLKEYLGDVYPDLFKAELTNKDDEAVANPERFDGVSGDGQSKKKLANDFYEQKMSSIFSNIYDQLDSGGVMTVMFTHKETDAWDTLAKSLINSGFIITSTHPITSEMPQRANMRGSASADSTLLLTGRKPYNTKQSDDEIPTLWSDVKSDTREVAQEAARDLLDSGLSLTKTDVIISAFGPTLKVYANAYPVVDEQDEEVPPRIALEEAREAVTRILVEEYLEGDGLSNIDDITEWYILSWLVHESEVFDYDEGHQLGLGVGVDIDEIKRSTKIWGKKRGDIQLKTHSDRVQDISLPEEERSSRTPVDPEALSYSIALDAVHAAMHVYEKQGEDKAIEWLRERNLDTDAAFKSTLKALLQVIPQEHPEWVSLRDLTLGRTHDALSLDFTPTDLNSEPNRNPGQSELSDHT